MIAQLVIQGLALPMVHYFGQGDSAKGYQATMGDLLGAGGRVLLHHVRHDEGAHPAAARPEGVRPPALRATCAKNGPWLAMFVLTLILFITLPMRGSVVLYYFTYYVGRQDLFSCFNVLGTSATIIGDLLLEARWRCGSASATSSSAAWRARRCSRRSFLFLPPGAIDAMFATEIAAAVRVRVHDPAAVGDDGRRRGLLRVEEPASRDRRSSSRRSCSRSRRDWASAARSPGSSSSRYGYVPNVAQTARALDGHPATR